MNDTNQREMERCLEGRIGTDKERLYISTPMNVLISYCLFNMISSEDSNGGAIFIFGRNSANLNISECKFYKCETGGRYTGGAIFASMRESSLTRAAFDRCTSFFCFSFYIRSKFDFNFFFNQSSIFSCRNPAEAVALAYCGSHTIERLNCSYNYANGPGGGIWCESPRSLTMMCSLFHVDKGMSIVHALGCEKGILFENCAFTNNTCTLCLIIAVSANPVLNSIYIANSNAPFFAIADKGRLDCHNIFAYNWDADYYNSVSQGRRITVDLNHTSVIPNFELMNVSMLDRNLMKLSNENRISATNGSC